jgi:hypothetical protein
MSDDPHRDRSAARITEWILRIAIAIGALGLAARWLPSSSAIAGLLYLDHGWLGEGAAEAVDNGVFVVLAAAGLLTLTPRKRPALLIAGLLALLVSIATALRDAAWPVIVPVEQAVRYVAPLGLWLWFDRDGRPRPDLDAMVVFLLRCGVAATFVGHGLEALHHNARFLDLVFAASRRCLGTPLAQANAEALLTAIGVVDLIVAALLVVVRWRAVAAWMAFWGAVTAASRMVHSGMGAWPETALRALNCGGPFALVFAFTLPRKAPPPVGDVA